MQPSVTPIFHKPTSTWSYVVADPVTREAAVIDPVLDYDWRSARTGTASADEILACLESAGLSLRWILETMRTPTHTSRKRGLAAVRQAGGKDSRSARGSAGTGDLQAHLRLGDLVRADELWTAAHDGDTLLLGRRGPRHPTPGHTSDSVAYRSATHCSSATWCSCLTAGRRPVFRVATPRNCTSSVQSLYALRRGHARVRRPRLLAGGREVLCETTIGEQRSANIHSGPRRPGGLRGDAPHARRHARRSQPDHPVGAGQHTRRRPAAAESDGASYLKVPITSSVVRCLLPFLIITADQRKCHHDKHMTDATPGAGSRRLANGEIVLGDVREANEYASSASTARCSTRCRRSIRRRCPPKDASVVLHAARASARRCGAQRCRPPATITSRISRAASRPEGAGCP